MKFVPLPFRSPLEQYQKQAEELQDDHRRGEPEAIAFFHEKHPRFLDDTIKWLPKRLNDDEIRDAQLNIDDARLAVARAYNFRDWQALAEYVAAVAQDGPVFWFESAVEAVINGDLAALQALLREHPELVTSRSTRITNFDPPAHRATLLHYIGANGVEDYRQKTTPAAVDIARALLKAGAEVDALADMDGGHATTMSGLVSSTPPFEAGLQDALIDVLAGYGAALDATSQWGPPALTALVFGFPSAARALIKRGARVDNVAIAAGLGMRDETDRLLAHADVKSRHAALALAAQYGHADVVQLLLDAGEDPSRYNPPGMHTHGTPLHSAAFGGHSSAVQRLVERGARCDMIDTVWQGTPLDWAIYGKQKDIETYLRSRGAKTAAELASA